MDKLNKIYYDIETKIKNKPVKYIIGLYILLIVSIIS